MTSYGEYIDDTGAEPLNLQVENKSARIKHIKMVRSKFIAIVVIVPVIAFIIGILIGVGTNKKTSDVVSKSGTMSQQEDIKKILFENMKAENIKENLRVLASKVHVAGTESNDHVLVDFIVGRWKEQLDEVKVYPYDVQLTVANESNPNYVAVRHPDNYIYNKSAVYEPPLTPKENFTDVPVTFNAYGAAGHVEGDMVYVNFGRRSDFETLKKTLRVDVTGKICIARYGKVFRGDKAEEAEAHGCSGLIIFTDPADFGDRDNPNSTFPESWWMPHSGIQRGSLYIRNGDPLTPFFPATEYAYRISENETGLPNIPVQPISSDDAFLYLSKLAGKNAPDDWQGGLNITYKLGGVMAPGYENHKFVLHVGNYRPRTIIKNIVGFIRGAEEPDRHVILGNHRDAWVFGAVDPSSGTAVMLEVARVLGELVKSGKWRPRRSIMFCSWDAEETGLIGSTEWVEQFEKKLMLEAVTYLNVDIAIQGNATLRVKATPNFRKLLYNVTKGVKNPDPNEIALNRPTVYDTWKEKYYDEDDKSRPYLIPLGSGSDFLMFMQKAGVSSIDFRYTWDEIKMRLSSYPVYHSAHDTIEYVEKFLDPEYKVSLAVGQVWCDIARRLADDTVISFDPLDYANEVSRMIDVIVKNSEEILQPHDISLDGLKSAASNFTSAAQDFVHTMSTVNTSNAVAVRRINDKLMLLERTFLDFNGLPGRPFYRHIVYAPSRTNSYRGSGFPGLVDAIVDANENGDWESVKIQVATTIHHITSASSILKNF